VRWRDRRGAAAAGQADAAAAGRAPRRERPTPARADLTVRLQPRASRDEVAGERGGAVVIRVTAPPVDGKANDALCRLIAKAAGIAPSKVSVVRGHTAREKVVRVEGVALDALRAALGV
jgi:uncharacterized protein